MLLLLFSLVIITLLGTGLVVRLAGSDTLVNVTLVLLGTIISTRRLFGRVPPRLSDDRLEGVLIDGTGVLSAGTVLIDAKLATLWLSEGTLVSDTLLSDRLGTEALLSDRLDGDALIARLDTGALLIDRLDGDGLSDSARGSC